VALNNAVEQLWTCSVSKRTKNVYETGFSHYKRFLLLNNINFVNNMPPVSEDKILR